MQKLWLSVLALLVPVLAYSSCPQGTVNCKRPFSTVDANASGGISFAEFQAVYPYHTHYEFQQIDSNGDDSLSEDEYSNMIYCRTPNSGDPYC